MVIIGIAGSNATRRDAVAEAAAEAKLRRLLVHAVYNPTLRGGRGSIQSRVQRIGESIEDVKCARMAGALFSQVLTEPEAQQIRDLGGVMWHVQGVPSSEVAIQRGDLMVTSKPGGDRHFLDPVEALSATLLALDAREA
ncbi:hypothetical protein NFH98_20870 [Halomonas sp. H33-56]|uniref:hypothetical protein n=1 Tax=Halomonas sp. H33-56 TaxID=2950873 RepID=UPI0032E016C8